MGRLIDGHYWLKDSSDFEGYSLGFLGGCKGEVLTMPFIFSVIGLFFRVLVCKKPFVCFFEEKD
jgi:hypothetical protein